MHRRAATKSFGTIRLNASKQFVKLDSLGNSIKERVHAKPIEDIQWNLSMKAEH